MKILHTMSPLELAERLATLRSWGCSEPWYDGWPTDLQYGDNGYAYTVEYDTEKGVKMKPPKSVETEESSAWACLALLSAIFATASWIITFSCLAELE